jgi:uncharacterized caspase-like protein
MHISLNSFFIVLIQHSGVVLYAYARDMGRVLKRMGFEVILKTDASQRTMKRAIREFGEKLEKTGGSGLFYFAGHGIQINGNIPFNLIYSLF